MIAPLNDDSYLESAIVHELRRIDDFDQTRHGQRKHHGHLLDPRLEAEGGKEVVRAIRSELVIGRSSDVWQSAELLHVRLDMAPV